MVYDFYSKSVLYPYPKSVCTLLYTLVCRTKSSISNSFIQLSSSSEENPYVGCPLIRHLLDSFTGNIEHLGSMALHSSDGFLSHSWILFKPTHPSMTSLIYLITFSSSENPFMNNRFKYKCLKLGVSHTKLVFLVISSELRSSSSLFVWTDYTELWCRFLPASRGGEIRVSHHVYPMARFKVSDS